MKRLAYLILIVSVLMLGGSAYGLNLNKKHEPVLNPYAEKVSIARAMYAQNNLDEAFNILSSVPYDERTSDDWLLMGNINQDKGDIKSAIKMLEKAIGLDKKNYKAYYNLGILYFEQEKYSLALENFKNAKKYKLDNPSIYYNLGCTYIYLGEFRKAKNELMYAIELKNNVPEYYFNTAYAYKKLGNDKKSQYYMDLYDKAVKISSP